MPNPFVILTLVLPFVLQTMCPAFIVADYYANKKVYMERCENKARLQMHCRGKCQMRKKLEKEKQSEEQNPFGIPDIKFGTPLSSRSFFGSLPASHGSEVRAYATVHIYRKTVKHARSIFHPPCV